MITHDHKLARAIAAGRVTQYRHARTTLKPGHDYPVQPALGKPATCRVTITETRDQLAGEATFFDARAEGYKTTEAWKAAWVRQYDRPWVKRQPQARAHDDDHMASRFDARHANTLTQVVTLKVLSDESRYLASQRDILTGRCDSQEYTTRRGRAIDELEVVDNATVERWALKAYEVSETQRQAVREGQAEHKAHAKAQRGRSFRTA